MFVDLQALQLRLTPAQQLVLHHNRVVLMIMAGKNDSAKEIVKAMCNR